MDEAGRFERTASVFDEVLGLPVPERMDRLDALCADDGMLRDEVLALLEEHERISPLDQQIGAAIPDVEDQLAQPSPRISRIKLAGPLGEGGMGVVYEGRLLDPPRAVAVKVIKRGMDSRQVLARFDLERQALARMEHPNIASVIDAGLTEDGRPYFAMELVRGQQVVRYCKENRVENRACLGLFIAVCGAIQHAHQKGIIHRDIKPSNVLVAMHDGRPIPKVIDFGIAKATETGPGVQMTMTIPDRAIGTPAYMSPEQADPGAGGVDTRTDIYSLGVLLYELLTGTTPLLERELRSKSYADMVRMISEQEPPKPSDRVSTLSSAAGSAQAPARGQLAGDLDWIVMKCLEKDPARRYETVGALSDDIRRYLANEPIIARPPSSAYKLQKFVQRNRGRVLAGSAVLCVLLLGIAGTTGGLIWALDERELAREAARDEQAASLAAIAAAELAASEAEAAEELSHFFIMDVLSAADPARALDRELTVREALVNASVGIEGRFQDRPEIESQIHNALGYLFGRLGSPELAEHHHMREWQLAEEAGGEVSIDSARMMHSVVASLAGQGRDAEAIELTNRQLKIIDQLSTPEAEQLRPRVIGNLGSLLVRTGKLAEAAPILKDTLRIKRAQYGDRHPTTLSTIDSLARVLINTGHTENALVLAQEAYDGRISVLGDGDPRTFNSIMTLALAQAELEDFDAALSLLRGGVQLAETRLGPEHPTSLIIKNIYARTSMDSGDLSGAEETARDLIKTIGSTNKPALEARGLQASSILARALSLQSRHVEASAAVEQTVRAARIRFSENALLLSDYLRLQGVILRDAGRYSAAETVLLEAWNIVDPELLSDAQYRALTSAFVGLYEAWDAAMPDRASTGQIQLWRSRLRPEEHPAG